MIGQRPQEVDSNSPSQTDERFGDEGVETCCYGQRGNQKNNREPPQRQAQNSQKNNVFQIPEAGEKSVLTAARFIRGIDGGSQGADVAAEKAPENKGQEQQDRCPPESCKQCPGGYGRAEGCDGVEADKIAQQGAVPG